jgi:N-carbamoylputrescine amidase
MHIPDDPRYYEKYYFTPGDLGFRSFETGAGPVGVLVCWDQWYPEAARLTALQGAEVLVYPTAIGWHVEEKDALGEAQHDAWELAQRAHAVANGCYVIAVNRTGFEPDPAGKGGIEFWGQSFVAAPDGRVLVRGPAGEEAILRLDLDRAAIETARVGWPFLRDRRIDAYEGITRRFGTD